MAGIEEVNAFVEQNKIRSNPRSFRQVIEDQLTRFSSDGFTLNNPNGLNRQTH